MLTKFQKTLLCFLVFGTGCGAPQSDMKAHVRAVNPVIFDEPAIPTEDIPPDQNFQAPPTSITNTQGSKKVEVRLGKAKLSQTILSYNSTTRNMRVSGHVVIKNDKQEQIAEKYFALTGIQKENENTVTLSKDEASGDKNVIVKAKAICLGVNENDQTDCSHVVVDVYILHDRVIHTDQVEARFTKAAPPPQPKPAPPVAPPPPAAVPPKTPEPAIEGEVQGEDNDESISGRYQGSVPDIDLVDLFYGYTEPVPPAAPSVPSTPSTPSAPSAPPAPPVSAHPKERLLSPDLKQTPSGEVRPVNQAIGFPDEGRLRNATSLYVKQQALDKKAPFEIVSPGRQLHYATFELSEMIVRAGQELLKDFNKKLYVSNTSAQQGGKLAPHASHQIGVDADLAYPGNNTTSKFPIIVSMKTREYTPQNFSLETTYKLFKFLFAQNDIKVDRIFVDQSIKKDLCAYAISQKELEGPEKEKIKMMFENLQHVNGHGDHFHLRIKCSNSDPGCRSRIYRKMESCTKG